MAGQRGSPPLSSAPNKKLPTITAHRLLNWASIPNCNTSLAAFEPADLKQEDVWLAGPYYTIHWLGAA